MRLSRMLPSLAGQTDIHADIHTYEHSHTDCNQHTNSHQASGFTSETRFHAVCARKTAIEIHQIRKHQGGMVSVKMATKVAGRR